MNLLLLDDEEYMIESIKKNLDWKKCCIEEIYTAFSVKQAQKIMEMAEIDVIISDIVMPGESGFDFIGWVRENGYEVSVIFLTSYAEFDFAKKAIELDSVDYLLKPVDFQKLTETLCEAIRKREKARKYENYRKDSSHWKRNQSIIRREFWREALMGEFSREEFDLVAARRNLEDMDKNFYLLYVCFCAGMENKEVWDKWTLYFVVENVLSELLGNSSFSVETVVSIEKGSCTVICRELGEVREELEWKRAFEQFACWFSEKMGMDIWCGAAAVEDCSEIAQILCQIQKMRENSLSVRNKVLYLQDFIQPENTYRNPNMELWKALMEEGKEETLNAAMKEYLETIERNEMVTRKILEAFRVDVTQIVYSWLAKKEIKAHLLFSGQENKKNSQNALSGIHGALKYASDLIHEAIQYEKYVYKTASVTEKICQYIDSHYREEIKRETLAEMVYLNTDYMSRIFKEELGISISSYILQKRVEEAKKLLSQSDLPINTVSIYVGYSNFSYFTKMFKENTGYSPLEYRRNFRR